ncbi:MAG: Holliday junction branch migration protein RuvA [Clostridia bacterium]|nr:Holliday junction branch migration protein RuvA [Clostridia bacterium]
MISYIKGELVYIGENSIIVDNCGIGYNIFVSAKTTYKLPHINNEVKVFTYMDVKEDSLQLYGFLSMEELNMFNLLITVNGVGPKGALAILSDLTPSDILLAISCQDSKALCVGKGVGKKTAEMIILKLKDKISTFGAGREDISVKADTFTENRDEKNDAVAGLVALGFTKIEAAKAVESVYTSDMDSAKIISAALKLL